ncbi:MAG: FkbM family methyltransferase [Gaiellaceae bacterium]
MRIMLPAGWDDVYVSHSYEPDVASALERLVHAGSTCVDAGAHFGYFTLLLARLVGPKGRVVAFEVERDNAELVRRNIRLNNLNQRVTVECLAVLGSSGPVELFAGSSGGSTEWTVDAEFAAREDAEPRTRPAVAIVPSVSLDEYFGRQETVDLIKMDIEGAEAKALPGMKRLLTESRPVIVLEFHREAGWPAIETLIACGYQFETLAGDRFEAPRSADEVPYHLVARPLPV